MKTFSALASAFVLIGLAGCGSSPQPAAPAGTGGSKTATLPGKGGNAKAKGMSPNDLGVTAAGKNADARLGSKTK
jgi:hypothetical protein